MRFGVVGAGIAGLAAARSLKERGHDVVVFEANDHVGGRASTEEFHGTLVDTGMQAYTPRGMSIERAIRGDLPTECLVEVAKPIYLLDHHRAMPGSEEKNSQARYTYSKGNAEFCRLMAVSLDIRLSESISQIDSRNGTYKISGEEFNGLVLTAPVPELDTMLASAGIRRNLSNCRYRMCLSVALGYDCELEPVPYSGLLNMDRMSPVLWLGIEGEKCPGRVPPGKAVFVAQFSPAFSKDHFGGSVENIAPAAISEIARLFGSSFAQPAWSYLRRWRYSQPESIVLFDSVNPIGEKVVIAGDGTLAGRAENAFETGIWAANRILEAFR